ncbi:MAG: hypothetical protein ABSB33_14200, partial [Tepidisphaeraceae bacterium]
PLLECPGGERFGRVLEKSGNFLKNFFRANLERRWGFRREAAAAKPILGIENRGRLFGGFSIVPKPSSSGHISVDR